MNLKQLTEDFAASFPGGLDALVDLGIINKNYKNGATLTKKGIKLMEQSERDVENGDYVVWDEEEECFFDKDGKKLH